MASLTLPHFSGPWRKHESGYWVRPYLNRWLDQALWFGPKWLSNVNDDIPAVW